MSQDRQNFLKMYQLDNPSYTPSGQLATPEEANKMNSSISEYISTIHDAMDKYLAANTVASREYLCYLTTAIFLTYKKYFPQLSIYIPFRTKSDISFSQNIKKEFIKFSKKIKNKDNQKEESNTQQNSSNDDEDIDYDVFDPTGILKDISGIKVVLDNINFSIPPNRKLINESTDPELKQTLDLLRQPSFHNLIDKANDNLAFIDEIEEFINSSKTIPIKKFYQYKVDLLRRISENTPESFTRERAPKKPFSYHEFYKDELENLKIFIDDDSFPSEISESEKQCFFELIDNLRSRVHDVLHFEILEKTLPIILEEPIIKNGLKVSISGTKTSEKPNGFKAIYYTLNTPFGLIELQSQSNKAYYASTKGSAFHSGIKGKGMDIEDFFELTNPHDEYPKEHYMDSLDSYSADFLISEESLPYFESDDQREEYMKTPQGKKYEESQKIKEQLTHIKLKDVITFSNLPEQSENANVAEKEPSENTNVAEKKPNVNEILLSMALAYSAYMNVCSSGHTSTTTASIHHKKIVGEFAEVLRKRDTNTCLREILIRRVKHIIEGKIKLNDPKLEEKIKEHNDVEIKLPKDIAMKNVIRYASDLQQKLNGDVSNEKSK